MRQFPSFSEHDTTLSFWLEDPQDPRMVQIRNAWVRNLRARGFRVQLDQHTAKHYPCLKKYHHEGSKGQLQFKLRLSGRSLELLFFQNVVTVNRSGGQYDFDRLEKMPYLIRKQYEAERRDLAELMARLGYAFKPQTRRHGVDRVNEHRQSWMDSHGADFYSKPREPYNRRGATGRPVQDGDRVFIRINGRLASGAAYYSANSMWIVLLPCGDTPYVSCGELRFREDVGDSLRGRWFPPDVIEKRLRAKLAEAVKAEAFERAAVLRDVLRQRFPTKAAA